MINGHVEGTCEAIMRLHEIEILPAFQTCLMQGVVETLSDLWKNMRELLALRNFVLEAHAGCTVTDTEQTPMRWFDLMLRPAM